MQYNGLFGDFVGGVYGTVIGAVTMVLVYLTWKATRQTDYKTKTYQVFIEMLRTHEEIVGSLRLGEAVGREAIAAVLSEFSFIYRLTRRFVPSDLVWSMKERIDIAFTYTYFGAQLQTQRILSHHDPALLKLVGDAITKKQQSNAKGRTNTEKKRMFRGHQYRLSQFFRNLFNAYEYISGSELDRADKQALGKVLRSKLSNYEQALLALNILSHMGQDWTTSGLLRTYKPIKNIPKDFFSFDDQFELKKAFPCIDFEWERQNRITR